jgi:hypothetical protein
MRKASRLVSSEDDKPEVWKWTESKTLANHKPPYEKVFTSSPVLSREKRSRLTPWKWMDCILASLRQILYLRGSPY